MTTVGDICRAIEVVAPLAGQDDWDNSGLQVGRRDSRVQRVMLALDPTPAVIDEAMREGCRMVVTHHPLIFKALRNITGETLPQRAVMDALRGDIAVYGAHTSLDNAPGGVAVLMARMLGLRDLEPLITSGDWGCGTVGTLPPGEDLAGTCRRVFGNTNAMVSRYQGAVSRVAVCGGAGGSLIEAARAASCQALVTGEIRYHDFVDHGNGMLLIAAGHYQTELPALQLLHDAIKAACPDIQTIISKQQNPIKQHG